jgi:hypothetical protein
MSELANQVRAVRLDKHIEFMLLGDPAKLLLLPLWAERTGIPNVHQAVFTCAGDQIRCNVWDLAENADATCRMFPMDGTINTGFDYCIVIYDTITRIKAEQLDKWITIKDQICSRQHPDRNCQLVVLVIKTPRTPIGTYEHIVQSCAKLKIHMIPVDNTRDGLDNIKTLLERLSNLVYKERRSQHNDRIRQILSEQSFT